MCGAHTENADLRPLSTFFELNASVWRFRPLAQKSPLTLCCLRVKCSGWTSEPFSVSLVILQTQT